MPAGPFIKFTQPPWPSFINQQHFLAPDAGCWIANIGNGAVLPDLSQQLRHGIIGADLPNFTWAPAEEGGGWCLRAAGVGEVYNQIVLPAWGDISLPFTICAVITPVLPQPIIEGILSTHWVNGAYSGLSLNIDTSNRVYATIGDGVGEQIENYRFATSANGLTAGQTCCISAVFNAIDSIDIYINGVKDNGSDGGTGASLGTGGSSSGVIGFACNTSGSGQFEGDIHAVMAYSRALSSYEVENWSENPYGCIVDAIDHCIIIDLLAKFPSLFTSSPIIMRQGPKIMFY